MDLNSALEVVKQRFEACPEHTVFYSFRNKYLHTLRVLAWARRLLKHERADADAVLMAAVFHDVGYTAVSDERAARDHHPRHSAALFRKYAARNGFDAPFTERVSGLIELHGHKKLLYEPSVSIEQILLIEADNLDESGAMAILRDALSEGRSGTARYEEVLRRTLLHPITEEKIARMCVSQTARAIWREKQTLWRLYIASLARDMGGEDPT